MSYTVTKDTLERRMVRDSTYLAMRRPAIKGSFDLDVTAAVSRIWELKDAGGTNISLACYLMFAYLKTLEKFPELNSMLNYKGDTYTFQDIDLFIPIQVLKDRKLHLRHGIIRKANRLTLEELAERLIEEHKKPLKPLLPSQKAFLKLPFFLRKLGYKVWEGFPLQFKHQLGTSTFSYLRLPAGSNTEAQIHLSSINVHTTSMTIAAHSARRPKEGERQVATASLSTDHRIVDGMPLLKAGAYFEKFVGSCQSLPKP